MAMGPLIWLWQDGATANPVIPFRMGQGILRGPQAFVPLGHQRFPYFQPAAPTNPVIPFVYGRPSLDVATGVGKSQYLPVVHYPAPTPVIPFTISPALRGTNPPISSSVGRVLPFPAAEEVRAFIEYRRGQAFELPQPFVGNARYHSFPYFNDTPAAPAQPPIFYSYGRFVFEAATVPVRSRFQDFPYQPAVTPPAVGSSWSYNRKRRR